MELTKNNVTICLEHIGEGWSGDFDPDDPNDKALLRFDVSYQNEEVSDASYCTQLPDEMSDKLKSKALEFLMSEIGPEVEDGHPVKKLCERLSWIEPKWLE